MAEGSVLMLEPQCFGFEHATFNAALLRTVQLAFPGGDISFGGETGHLEEVRAVLVRQGLDPAGVKWEEWSVPPQKKLYLSRFPFEFGWARKLSRRAREVSAVVLCSVTPPGLIALKGLMAAGSVTTPVVAVPHGYLATILLPGPRRPWQWAMSMKAALCLPAPRSLRLVALGESIYRQLQQTLPARRMDGWATLELPYFWPREEAPVPPAEKIRFGFFGVTNKGFGRFSDLADAIVATDPRAEFVVVGFQVGPAPAQGWSRHLEGLGTVPLDDREFVARGRSLHYSVWTGNPGHYRLTASASFLDSFACLTPVIALRNQFIEHYFQKLGDIGYLCDNQEEMRKTILNIAAEFPAQRHQQQRRNLLAGRSLFTPENLAPRLRAVIASAAEERKPNR